MSPIPIAATSRSPVVNRTGYQPQLDGLRGIAILSVLIHHFDVHLPIWIDWGPIGVRTFFLLSGYLITLSIWKMNDRTDSFREWCMDLGVFHGRRLVRLLPVLYLMLGVGWLMGLPEIQDGIWWHATFLTNFFTLTQDEWPGAASHLWSLSLQEQFYVLWPFLLLFVPKRHLPWVLVALIGFALGFRVVCLQTDSSVFLRWVMLPAVIDSFAMGSLVACWAVAPRRWNLTSDRLGWALLVAAAAAYMTARVMRITGFSSPWMGIIETLENFCLAWLVLRTTVGWNGWFGRLLENSLLRYLGKISFGLYVFHVLVHVAFAPWLAQFGVDNSFIRAAILMVLTGGIAALSWHSMEAPLNAWFRKPKPLPDTAPAAVMRKPYPEAD